jgi:hypothetical protein
MLQSSSFRKPDGLVFAGLRKALADFGFSVLSAHSHPDCHKTAALTVAGRLQHQRRMKHKEIAA